MLDVKTKQTIDNACDVLVGKVPSPQTQVEIITAALIYKFMDDMDLSGVELSGKRTFFVGDLEPYAFSTIVHTKGNQERMNRYLEGLERVQVARTVPELFRRIFKDTMIPFRDSNTFSLFLKEIAELPYEDSEKLGDAFEYLLNRMGTQGNAGQFRTPRNIIDFIVNVVDPTKDDTILDPACGTAGFLISAYKHITSNKNITPDEFKKITANITGLDIDPTMVKLALVNLYLHKFQKPNVYEYDTLSNDARWDDSYDVILANPPFMTPKGGIVPHKRFAIQANRSEVLFVDYFMEHLTPKGRAGFVVPEGIIFQTANAYKDLRKMMLNGYLYAVVSLPSGVFNPYSGVKTSILFFDRTLAKRNDNVLFVRVDNDGYSLGAQRTLVKQNDLPEALKIINEYREGKDVSGYERAMVVSKERIAGNNYDLTAAKYIEKEARECKYEMVKLGDVCELIRGVTYAKQDEVETSNIPVLRANNIDMTSHCLDLTEVKYLNPDLTISDNKKLKKDDIFICLASGSKQHIGKVAFIDVDTNYYFGGFMGAIRCKDTILPKYLFSLLATDTFNNYLSTVISGVNINNLNAQILYSYEIPLPPLDVQRQIVDEIENKQSAINHARDIVNNLEKERQYFTTLLDGMDYKEVKLADMEQENQVEFLRGQGISKSDFDDNGAHKCIHYGDLYTIYEPLIKQVLRKTNADLKIKSVSGDVLVPATTTADAMGIAIGRSLNEDGVILGGDINIVRTRNKYLLADYLAYVLCYYVKMELAKYAKGVNILHLSNNDIKQMVIPLPSIDDQKRIVAKLESEQEIIDANKRLIDLMQDKINQVINRIYKCDL